MSFSPKGRSLVIRVGDALQNDPELSVSELSAWENWALGEADRIDPVKSGQFRDNLHPPALADAKQMACGQMREYLG